MKNRRWNPALRHTVLGGPGNERYTATLCEAARRAREHKAQQGHDPRPPVRRAN